MSKEGRGRALTTTGLRRMKEKGERIVALTAYDALFARLEDQAGVDLILVGDSVGMVYGGRPDTLAVTVEQMVYHTACVRRGVERALLVTDMPFLSVQGNADEALRHCGRMLAEGGAQAVKVEGCRPVLETIRRLVDCGIPVMGHLGLIPQSIHRLGGWGQRGRGAAEAERLFKEARLLEEAGCFSLVLEKVEPGLAARITASLAIPVIGIGSGSDCDGQVLVNMDMLGLYEELQPAFARRFASLAAEVRAAVEAYGLAVREGNFPGPEEI
ncbi:MAG: 3-methyl-2-oxobutanoate hydroxymethyltransferase [bacterium]|nr:3-methyl-2-oxobutanoate hydroxymethyltransferase [bacterium]